MKNYNIFEEETGLNQEQTTDFLIWMVREFPNYVAIQAHDENDFMSFIAEFKKSYER